MTQPTTGSEGGDPKLTHIVGEFIRARDAGELDSLEEFCARYPEDQRADIRRLCEQVEVMEGQMGIQPPKPLRAGQVLAHYEVLAPLGKGGMGEVYRAVDTKLNREVALKVLPPELAADPERVKRFEREAEAVATLAHPNIVTIHSVEESEDGLRFLTMELIEGGTLVSRIRKRGLRLENFFDLAIPMADAISAAHEQGITHRDLKPANIMVTKDGRVKILDFGLAKLRKTSGPVDTTQSVFSSLTGEGRILGTAAYMSPEQAEGKPVDHRTDIFSLGIILYEMVTGERPFKGDSMVSLVSSIVRDTPTAVRELNPRLPNHLGRIISRLLEKNPEQRIQSAKDLRNELTVLKREVDSGEVVGPLPDAGRRGLWPVVSAALLAALLLLLLAPGLVFGGDARDVVLDRRQLTDRSGQQRWASLSPDGKTFLYHDQTSGNQEIYRQRIGGGPTNLTRDDLREDYYAAFDPTGDRIAYTSRVASGGGIFVMAENGGDPTPIVDGGFNPSWSPDGTRLIYGTVNTYNPFSRNLDDGSGELRVVEVETGMDWALDTGEVDAFHPSWSPNDKRIAFAGRGKAGQRDVWTISTSGEGLMQVLNDVHTDWDPFWSRDGSYLYFLSDRGREGKPDLWRVPIDEDSGHPEGDPEEVWAPEIGRVTDASCSGDKIVCTLELANSSVVKIGFDPVTGQLRGEEEELYYTSNDDLWSLALSPRGEWLAFITQRGVEDMFVVRTDGSSQRPRNLTGDLFNDRNPAWYPGFEGGVEWLTFHSNRGGSYGIWRVRPNGSELQPFRLMEIGQQYEARWPDSRHLNVSLGRLENGNLPTRAVFEFPDGLDEPPIGPREPRLTIQAGSSWSRPDRRLFAHRDSGRLMVFSVDPRAGFPQVVQDANKEPHRAGFQHGNRWLNHRRLIFWDRERDAAFLWDVESQESSVIEGITQPAEFAFSNDGETLYMLRKNISSNIWLLELSH